MCILGGQRCQTMSLLNTNYMHIYGILLCISFKNFKAWFPPTLSVTRYLLETNELIVVVSL